MAKNNSLSAITIKGIKLFLARTESRRGQKSRNAALDTRRK
jgi:hypothetical protein